MIYALAAAGVLALGCYALYERGNAANARADSAEHLIDQFKVDLAESEADKANLKARNKALDATVKARDVRVKELDDAKRAIKGELDELKESAAKEDQDCLDRDLPDAFAKRLRDSAPNKDGAGAGPGNPHVTVPEVVPSR